MLGQVLGTGGISVLLGGFGTGAWKVGNAMLKWKRDVDQALADCKVREEAGHQRGLIFLRGLGVLTTEVLRLDPEPNIPLRRVRLMLNELDLPPADRVLAGLADDLDEKLSP